MQDNLLHLCWRKDNHRLEQLSIYWTSQPEQTRLSCLKVAGEPWYGIVSQVTYNTHLCDQSLQNKLAFLYSKLVSSNKCQQVRKSKNGGWRKEEQPVVHDFLSELCALTAKCGDFYSLLSAMNCLYWNGWTDWTFILVLGQSFTAWADSGLV